MEAVKLVVDQKACAFSDWELRKKNIQFLEGIDPGYFSYVASINLEKLSGDDRHYAALSLRISYYQGMETLFALIAATIQAPNCPLGWMLTYENKDLKSVVRKISSESDIYTRLSVDHVSWKSLSAHIHSQINTEPDEKRTVSDKFGSAWRNLAADFIDNNLEAEYNSAKHGLRMKSGGFSVAFGKADVWGVAAPQEKMECIGGSEHGATFFVKSRIRPNPNIHATKCKVAPKIYSI